MTRFIEFTDRNNNKVTINPDYIIKFYAHLSSTTPVTVIHYQYGKLVETIHVNISYEEVKIKVGVFL